LFNTILTKMGSFFISKANKTWDNVKISKDAVIEGKKGTINIGIGTEIEAGTILSSKYGGSITIGKNCFIRRGAMLLTYGGNIVLGDYCGVNIYSVLYGHGGLLVGDYVQFAAHCVVIPANHGFDSLDMPIWKQPLSKKGISIENDVWVGANVSILDGVQIGQGAVIGAGSVVTKNISPYSVNIGNPAKTIKFRADRPRQ
jgi:acetyltransferase-like isoleucine patch superfamily enzyme